VADEEHLIMREEDVLGILTVEEAKGVETTLDVVEGMQFDRGYVIGHSRAFPGLPGTFSASC
jgi:chaperonin GroEL (HSP60 family)